MEKLHKRKIINGKQFKLCQAFDKKKMSYLKQEWGDVFAKDFGDITCKDCILVMRSRSGQGMSDEDVMRRYKISPSELRKIKLKNRRLADIDILKWEKAHGSGNGNC